MKEKTYIQLEKAGYVILRFKNICILREYSKGNIKPYFKRIADMIIRFLEILGELIIIPFAIVYTILSYIPSIKTIQSDDPIEELEFDEGDIEVID